MKPEYRLMSNVMYYIFFSFCWIVTLLPFKVLYIFTDLVSFCSFHFLAYRKKVTLTNLKRSFPEKSSKEIEKIAKRFYRHFCDQIVESFKLLHMNEKQILRRYSYRNPEVLEELYTSNKSVIAVSGHYGNWEWLVSLPLVTRYKVLFVYKPPSNRSITRLYTLLGRKFGVMPITMQQLFRVILDYKTNKELTTTIMLGDQRPPPRNIKYWTNFLNQDTPLLTGFERISKKTNQAVIFINIQKKKRGYYEIIFQKLFENPVETNDFEITETYIKTLEKIIVDQPELWLWTHRRWKHRKQIQSQ
jgi:Kdo2-lipid IVA lauroyltransferase/acyltransferase